MVGLVLRGAMPFAYMQRDLFRLLITGAEWLTAAELEEVLTQYVPEYPGAGG